MLNLKRLLGIIVSLLLVMTGCMAYAEAADPLHLDDIHLGISATQMVDSLGPFAYKMPADKENPNTILPKDTVIWILSIPGNHNVQLTTIFWDSEQNSGTDPLLDNALWYIASVREDESEAELEALWQLAVEELTVRYGDPHVYGEDSDMSDEFTGFYYSSRFDDTYELKSLLGWQVNEEYEYILSWSKGLYGKTVELYLDTAGNYAKYYLY